MTVSIRGAARLAGVDHSALVRQFSTRSEGGEQKPSKLAKFLTEQGVEGGDLASFSRDGIPDTVLAVILEYYAYECQPRYRSPLAKQCCRAFRAIGIRTWIQQQAGWSPSVTKPELEITMPTDEEMAYLHSRDWERKELAALDAGETPDYPALHQEFGERSGFARAQGAVRTHTRLMAIWQSLQKRIKGSREP